MKAVRLDFKKDPGVTLFRDEVTTDKYILRQFSISGTV